MKSSTAALIAATAALSADCAPPIFDDTRRHSPVRGRIVGWDGGKGRKHQPRNQPCECGSGKKAKRCCVFEKREQSHDVGGGNT